MVVVTVHAATKDKTKTRTKTRPKTALAPPWNVIVLDDPVTLMSYVTKVFVQVFGYSQDKANRLMLEVHKKGGRSSGPGRASRPRSTCRSCRRTTC